MKTRNLFVGSFIMLAASLASAAGAQEKKDDSLDGRIKFFEQMAKAHQSVADCLKAGKPETECRETMMKDGPPGGREFCPGMDDMMGGKGRRARMHRHDDAQVETAAPAKTDGKAKKN